MMLPDDPMRCTVTLAIFWFLGFTLVLCWTIYTLPDGGGEATWVPDVLRRDTCMIPLCPLVFIIVSVFWPITICVLIARQADALCMAALERRTKTPMREIQHHKEESYALLRNDEESCVGVDGGIPLEDFSDESPRSSCDEESSPLPSNRVHILSSDARRDLRLMPYQPTRPPCVRGILGARTSS
ncbi:hypothetical protein M406DRAFT_69314 [Cryphonectria parasitica EP155]|uniref:Uncharacterized protein n=1 Tax=Cryphonectria parasitica (strain ATCC 38755 / EP155) TaxID=660469 RepID=A0A9P4Y577_CRYP1|nr:uncharacterized protein M406DRAFT_69314 [Cryphonectria parasitica EP155]KAF3767152.1 hypothetical protein M406DRAFT_69314 [Cryphonectria parasitica EP155]